MEFPVVIRANNLIKRYRNLTAVNSISFAIHQGECYGLVGPNGAGKTSTMKMISCMSPVTEGTLWIQGYDVKRDQRAIKTMLGVVSQADSLDSGLSIIQNLLAHGRYFNIPRKDAHRRALEALELFQLVDKVHLSPDDLSGGMRRRLLIGRALLNEPSILILDEPTTGLDPQARHMVWDKLLHLKSQGITILLTTHYMEEASYLCDRLAIMDDGRFLAEGTPSELIGNYAGDQVVEIRVSPVDKAQLLERLREQELDIEEWGDSVFLYGDHNSDVVADGIIRRSGNLEDVFLRLTGRGLREI